MRIPVPLDGLDAEGDSVELVGLDSAPKQGQVTEIGSNFLTYDAFGKSSGIDTFTYKVRDRLGKERRPPSASASPRVRTSTRRPTPSRTRS